MRALYFNDINSVQFIQTPEPVIKDALEVKIRITHTGICGSEILGLRGGHPTRKPPIISGHEASGIVAETGAGVTSVKIGDRVAIEPQYGCGTCPDCMDGNYNVCAAKKVLGTTGWQGSFAEYVIVPEKTLCKLPDSMPSEYGALLEPLSVGFHAVEISRLKKGHTALIFGCGPIGIAIAMACAQIGAQKVICVDLKEYNLSAALQAGGTHAIKSTDHLVKDIMALTENRGADVVFVAAGANPIVDQSLDCVRRKGQIVLLAHFNAEISMDAKKLRWKEADMLGTFMFVRRDFENVIAHIHSGAINPDVMITEVVPIEQGVETILSLAAGKRDAVKILMAF